ncbi:MAG: flavin reductase family protein [bacterium]|nr:flavin reductase family protein [bacterium]
MRSMKDVEYLEYMWPMRHFLITCGDIQGRSNIIAVSFCMPVSKEPPMLACAIGQQMYSCGLIDKGGEFVVNVPPKELKRAIYYCGFHSGRDVDKFQESGLTPHPARRVKAPIITECAAFMECRVTQRLDNGDKRLFVGEVLEAYADETLTTRQQSLEYASGEFPQKIYGGRF